MSNNKKNIAAVALSGGVDSSVTAKILQQQGYEVIGITGKMVNTPAADKICENAKMLLINLALNIIFLMFATNFKNMLLIILKTSYKNGRTPNPCIVCNQFIKWG